MTREVILQLLTAFTGSLGFALLFGIRTRHLLYASFGGFVSWSVYLAVHGLSSNEFLACLAASIVAMIYSEIMARVRKCPATVFIIIAIIPLVPGGSLYYAMSNAVMGNTQMAEFYAHQTLIWVLAIAGGISFVTAIHELRSKKQ
ncbi:MAG: threonine/serine exporter family protein [Synergistaceae bacterium]|nr:threonine/serine exporter family protein [Synergistaceae bacterium]